MKKNIVIGITVMLVVALAAFAKTAARPRITKEQARAIALKTASGEIISEELEREHGILVWSFDIKTAPEKITEVQVNANTGKIAAVEQETPEHEADEQRKEKQEKHNER
jgi:peptidase YpeB-like protein